MADTHGIVYTPQPIVDFMGAAVEEVLRDEFGLALTDEQVCIIDPATGTGNFIINLLQRIHRQDPAKLPAVYAQRLFANEVMLLPYYVASLNIEHAYYELTGSYAPFEGLCFVDTLDLAEGAQMKLAFLTEKNSQRVERQKAAPITVIIGNPPYNVGQLNENDNNKNRKYEVIDRRVSETYSQDSTASNKNAVSDAYIKFFRWAADRLQGRDGIVCYVSNNGFFDGIAFDGFRKHMLQDFTRIYHLDLAGNARTSGERRRKEGGNVFLDMIRVGIGITIAVRSSKHQDRKLFYHRVPDYWEASNKLAYLEEMVEVKGRHNSLNTVEWVNLEPDDRYTWLVPENVDEFESLIPIGSKELKAERTQDVSAIFKLYSRGLETTRDDWVYSFNRSDLLDKTKRMVETYNSELDRWKRAGKPNSIDDFVLADEHLIKWSSGLKQALVSMQYAKFDEAAIRTSMYRPFTREFVYFDEILNHRQGQFRRIFPTNLKENLLIGLTDAGSEKPFMILITDRIADLHLVGAGSSTQCFPFYVYDEDGSNRRENITDWALARFRSAYGDESISKWDIFYYVYGLLHLPAYRDRYAGNLKRELPRIPLVGVDIPAPPLQRPDSRVPTEGGRRDGILAVRDSDSPAAAFRAFSTAGQQLAALHLNYESLEPYPLQFEWKAGKPVSYRVEDKMKLSKDKTAVQVNPSLILRGIPPETFEYRLGNRSALDWVIDQYQVKTDKRSGITSDPNQYSEDEQYIVKLVGQVTRVSLETVAILRALPELHFGG